jgi:NAD-dependent dihydropyrimidine dehydrogenase PreA subunit
MPLRDIILIDEDKCDGCGLCMPSCPEGALAIVDGKARLVSETFCDGMGACVGECPQDAMTVVKREAPEFDRADAMENMRKAESAGEKASQFSQPPHSGGCPDSRTMVIERKNRLSGAPSGSMPSELTQWPVQLHLVSPHAPYFDCRELLIAADCVPFADPNFHQKLLKDRSVVVGCPKLDDTSSYAPKLAEIIKGNDIPKITVAYMVVPCCMGILAIARQAVELSGKDIAVEPVIVGIDGQRQQSPF